MTRVGTGAAGTAGAGAGAGLGITRAGATTGATVPGVTNNGRGPDGTSADAGVGFIASSMAAVSASGKPPKSCGRYFIWNALMTTRVCSSSSPVCGTA
jgi:hypothetical protein